MKCPEHGLTFLGRFQECSYEVEERQAIQTEPRAKERQDGKQSSP